MSGDWSSDVCSSDLLFQGHFVNILRHILVLLRFHLLLSLGQQYAPALDNIAMQGLKASTVFGEVQNVGAISTSYKNSVLSVPGFKLQDNKYIGYEPAWSELMTAVSKPHATTTLLLANTPSLPLANQ